MVIMQASSLQWKLEQEGKTLNSKVYDLERKLDAFRQELSVAESTVSVKDSELAALKNNLDELEELREMKEVLILLFLLSLFGQHAMCIYLRCMNFKNNL